MKHSRMKARYSAAILSACLLLGATSVAAQPAPPPGHDPHGHMSLPPAPQGHMPMPAPGHDPHGHMTSPAHAIPTPLNENSRYGQPPRHWTKGEKAWVRHVSKCQQRYRSYNWHTDHYYTQPGRARRCRM